MKATKRSPAVRPDGPALPAQLNLTATAVLDLDAGAEGASLLPRFRMVAYTGTPMRVAGWRHPVVIDLAGLAIPAQSRPIRFGHDPLSGIGHTDAIRVEQGVLIATGVVSRDTPAAREVVVSSKNGFPWQASVSAAVVEFEFVRENQTVTVNGREHTGPLNVVRKSSLGEISFVDLGADGGTSAQVAAQFDAGDLSVEESNFKEDERPLVSEAETHTIPIPAVRATTIAVEEMRAQAAAETERIAAIRRLCTRMPGIELLAIREGWSEQRTELECLRQARPAVAAIHVPDNTINAAVLEAACLLSAGLSHPDREHDTQSLDFAARRFRGGIGLQELLLEAA